MLTNLNFMLLTNFSNSSFSSISSYLSFIESCLQGGVNCIQLREKNLAQNELLSLAKTLKSLLDKYNIPLIINDNVTLAKTINASGVWLGQSDGSPSTARAILGDDKIIGVSIESEQDIEITNNQPINYVACSAVFASKSKSNLKKIWGLDGLQQVALKSKFSCFAIGGITLNNLSEVMNHGAYGIACINEIHEAKNPKTLCEKFTQIINTSIKEN